MTAALSPFAAAQPTLAALGYSPLPIISPNAQHGGRGKAPGDYRGGRWQGMSKWERFRDQTLSGFELGLAMKAPEANIGIVMGSSAGKAPDGTPLFVIAIDIDACDPDALDILMGAAPASPAVKRGQKGETRLMRAAKTIKSKPYDGPDGRLIDLLTGFDARQTVCPPSIHPVTGLPYQWIAGPVRADELPIFGEDDLAALEEALETCGWVRGGRGNAARKPRTESADVDPDSLWSETKVAALENLSKWVPALDLYGCRPARGGYEAVASWRASSTGRPLAERKLNLSIQRSGIKDFGTNDTYSAIDLVMAARDCEQAEATTWLRERLGLDDTGVVIELGALKAKAVSKASAEKNHAATQVAASWAKPFAWIEPASIPPREWLYNQHLIRKFVSATFSPGGVGKSSLKLVEAMAMASGLPLLGVKPVRRLRVAYWNGEDPFDETQRRAMAIAIHYGLQPADLEGWLFLGSGREAEIIIAQQTPSGATIMAPVVVAITADILTKALDVVIVDPFVSCHRVTENDNGAVDLVAKTWGRLADATGAAVELVHHTRKTNGAETTAEDGRGASSLLAAVRSAQVLNLMSRDEADRAGVDNHFAYFRADNGKANLAPRSDGAAWYRFVGVDLGNASGEHDSDKVGVVLAWSWPNAFDGVSAADLLAVQKRIDGGAQDGNNWRANVQAADWAGHAVAEVLGLNLGDRAAKQKVKSLLLAWLKEGLLVAVTTKDEGRRERPVIEVGKWAEIA